MSFDPTQVASYKSMILMEIGEQDNTGPVAKSIDNLWTIESTKGGNDVYLAYLYVKRKAIDITIGSVFRGNFVRVGSVQNEKLDDKTTILRQLREACHAEILSYGGSVDVNFDFIEPEAF